MRSIIPKICIVFFASCSIVFAQQSTDVKWLKEFSKIASQQWKQHRAEAESLATIYNIPIKSISPDGRVMELQSFLLGFPMYYISFNLNAAKTISTNRIWPGGLAGLNLTGNGYVIGEWDEGKVRDTHQELVGRVTQKDGASELNRHSTHVAGTLIASGEVADAKGMAFEAYLDAYDWNDDISEMANAAANGLMFSNHSYGYPRGWKVDGSKWYWFGNTTISEHEDYLFGFYDASSKSLDEVANNAPFYLFVQAAGNDRADIGPGSGKGHFAWYPEPGDWVWNHVVREPDGGTDGYDCLVMRSVAKNSLTVGAVKDIPTGYTEPLDVDMTIFSAWGPTDDGRIKPDIIANGVGLKSCGDWSDEAYYYESGTSMSAPNVTGSLALLQQHYKNLNSGNSMLASTLKALIIHSADEPDYIPGPDYKHGWGLMNSEKAAEIISENIDDIYIREYVLNNGDEIEFDVRSIDSEPLRATISWNDPAGTPPPPSLNPRTSLMLVNDLDLRFVKDPSTTHLPYVLDPDNPEDDPTNDDNIRDNVEQIHIDNPGNNIYTVRISHKGNLVGGSQTVSMIITGIRSVPVTLYQKLEGGGNYGGVGRWEGGPDFEIYPIPKSFTLAEESKEVFRGEQELYSGQKYNRWNNESDVTNHHVFRIQEGLTNLTSNFNSAKNGITIKNDFSGGDGDFIEFKDPWFIDYPDPDYSDNERNRGMKSNGSDALRFWSRGSPFYPDYDTPFGQEEYKYRGVFLNQDYNDPGVPYYSVRAKQNPTVPFHGKPIEWYFQGWGGTGVQFQNPNQTQTAVVFQASDAVVKVKYKGHLATNTSSTVATNSQRKILYDGTDYHMVYEDHGEIYYTSSGNGVDWIPEFRLSDGLGGSKDPCISSYSSLVLQSIGVVWQEENSIRIRTRFYSGVWGDIKYFMVYNSSYDATPVIDLGNDTHYYIVWRDAPYPGTEFDLKVRVFNVSAQNFGTAYQILETNNNSINPSMVSEPQGNFRLVWQENGKIYYSQFRPYGEMTRDSYYCIKECVSEATAWTTHMYPCVTKTYGNHTNVMWQAHHNALELELINYRQRDYPEGWGNTTTFIGEDENYLKPTITGFPGIQDNYKLKSVWRSEAMGLYVVKFTGSSWIPYFISNAYSYDPNLSVNKSTTENCRMVYRNYNSLPYLLDVTSQHLEDDPEEESLSKTTDSLDMRHHRRGVLKKGESEIAFELGRVKIDGQDVKFLPVGDSLVIGQNINLNQVFQTTPFRISNQSHLNFSFGSMIINRSNLLATTPPGKDIEFSIQITDAQTGQIIHNLDKWSAIKNLPSDTLLSRNFIFNISGKKEVFLKVDLNFSQGISAIESLVELYYIEKGPGLSKSVSPGTSSDIISLVPTKFELFQNYPNPFNPSTTISFDLPKECLVSVKIFNTLGELITTLVSDRLPAGTYQYLWNSQLLASGVYIYHLVSMDI